MVKVVACSKKGVTLTASRSSASSFSAGQFFQILRDGVPRTRAELASLTGFSRPTVMSRIDELIGTGLVTPVSDAASTGGRPSARIAFNALSKVVIAADIGATHIQVAVCDLAAAVLDEVQKQMLVSEGPEAVLSFVLQASERLLEKVGRPRSDVVAVGIGLPGPVDHATGRPSNPPIMPGWDDYDVPGFVHRAFDVPVLVDNDVNIMALGERATAWPDVDDMIFVKAATGIGSGIISDGSLRRGATGVAGDVGHVHVPRAAGISCRCGKTGCLEAYAGAPAIAASLRERGIDARSGQDIVEFVRSGNLEAARHVREAGRAIGEMLNMCVSVVNPSVIIVGGQLAQSGENLLAGIREEVYANSAPLATRDLTIVQSKSGGRAGVVGASILAIDYVLAPEYVNSMTVAGAEETNFGT